MPTPNIVRAEGTTANAGGVQQPALAGSGSAERGTRPIADYADPGFELRRPLRSVETATRNHIDRLMGTSRHRQAGQRLGPRTEQHVSKHR